MFSQHRFVVSATGIYGSGLTNGYAPDTVQPTTRTRLARRAFSRGTRPTAQASSVSIARSRWHRTTSQNLSLGYLFYAGRTSVKPEVYFTNLFNNNYILKGAFFSSEAVGRPFMVQFKLTVGV